MYGVRERVRGHLAQRLVELRPESMPTAVGQCSEQRPADAGSAAVSLAGARGSDGRLGGRAVQRLLALAARMNVPGRRKCHGPERPRIRAGPWTSTRQRAKLISVSCEARYCHGW